MNPTTVRIHKAFYVICEDCGYEEFDFHKDDAKSHADNHDCVKHLKRRINYSILNADRAKIDRFKIEVSRG